MSLILEALKKAERQHQLGEVPGIRPGPAESQTKGMRLLIWIMLLLFAALMLGLGLYLGGFWQKTVESPSETEAPEVQRSDAIQTPVEVIQTPVVEPVDPAPVALPPETVETVAPPPPPKPKPKPAKPLSEMPSGFVANLPALNIDIHSYDRRPAKRYVLINLEKYREGDYLSEGPLLVEILTDGVILEHLGQRFILPIGNQ